MIWATVLPEQVVRGSLVNHKCCGFGRKEKRTGYIDRRSVWCARPDILWLVEVVGEWVEQCYVKSIERRQVPEAKEHLLCYLVCWFSVLASLSATRYLFVSHLNETREHIAKADTCFYTDITDYFNIQTVVNT